MTTTSPSLLDRLATGSDQQSWNRFVDLYTPLLLAWCRRAGMDDADAADMMQAVFVILVERLPTFRYDSTKSFRAWLKTILLNAWRNNLQRSARQREEPADVAHLEDSGSFQLFEEAEYRSHLVQRALALMKQAFEPLTWQACWEFVVNDRPAVEVAQELGISVNAVYLSKSRVLRHLRQELQGFLD